MRKISISVVASPDALRPPGIYGHEPPEHAENQRIVCETMIDTVAETSSERAVGIIQNALGPAYPQIAITGARLCAEVKQRAKGSSFLPLLKNPKAEWADGMLMHQCRSMGD